MNRIKESYYT